MKKIQSILGSGWKVAASVGHVRDLPEKELGVSLPDFKPEYAPTARGKDVLKRLAALVKTADAVYLATDPDREGEAIAWHLQEALKLKKPLRVTFGSITKSAIEPAINKPLIHHAKKEKTSNLRSDEPGWIAPVPGVAVFTCYSCNYAQAA